MGKKPSKPASGMARNNMDLLSPQQMWTLGNKEGQRRKDVAFVSMKRENVTIFETNGQVAGNFLYMI